MFLLLNAVSGMDSNKAFNHPHRMMGFSHHRSPSACKFAADLAAPRDDFALFV